VSAPRVVSARQVADMARVLSDDGVIAVPGVGGYGLVALAESLVGVRRLAELGSGGDGDGAELPYMVGHRDQARDLASDWSEPAQQLVDRCWPGPITLIVTGTADDGPVRVSMAVSRPLRRLGQEHGPWRSAALTDTTAALVAQRFSATDVPLIVDGGTCDGPGATVVDARLSTLPVVHEGAIPAAFIEAALIMGSRRRKWFARRSGIPGSP
jgi:L-threonylcarbamoyladenylate synthase